MRICVQKSTGRVLEMQSDATEGTLTTNATIAGYPPTDLEERVVTTTEYISILAAQPLTVEETVRKELKDSYINAKETAKADSVVRYLRDHTPAECEGYVQAQVTDLASARQLMKKFAVALCVLTKEALE